MHALWLLANKNIKLTSQTEFMIVWICCCLQITQDNKNATTRVCLKYSLSHIPSKVLKVFLGVGGYTVSIGYVNVDKVKVSRWQKKNIAIDSLLLFKTFCWRIFESLRKKVNWKWFYFLFLLTNFSHLNINKYN